MYSLQFVPPHGNVQLFIKETMLRIPYLQSNYHPKGEDIKSLGLR